MSVIVKNKICVIFMTHSFWWQCHKLLQAYITIIDFSVVLGVSTMRHDNTWWECCCEVTSGEVWRWCLLQGDVAHWSTADQLSESCSVVTAVPATAQPTTPQHTAHQASLACLIPSLQSSLIWAVTRLGHNYCEWNSKVWILNLHIYLFR